MSPHCTVCGRELVKTSGPIGPTCLRKIQPRNRRTRKLTKKQYENICLKYDIYSSPEARQRKGYAGNGPTENDTTSENIEG